MRNYQLEDAQSNLAAQGVTTEIHDRLLYVSIPNPRGKRPVRLELSNAEVLFQHQEYQRKIKKLPCAHVKRKEYFSGRKPSLAQDLVNAGLAGWKK